MATWSITKLRARAGTSYGILRKTLEVDLLQTCFVVENFGSNWTCIAIRNAWRLLIFKVWRNITLDGFFIQDIAWTLNYLVSVTAGGPVSPWGHMKPSSTVDFGRFVAFGEHKTFPCLKLIEIVILLVYYTIHFGFSLFFALFGHFFSIFLIQVWLRITDEDAVPEMRIWSISLI